MITKEDKQVQAQARIEAALKKRTLARQLIAQAEHELWEARMMLEEKEKTDCHVAPLLAMTETGGAADAT